MHRYRSLEGSHPSFFFFFGNFGYVKVKNIKFLTQDKTPPFIYIFIYFYKFGGYFVAGQKIKKDF